MSTMTATDYQLRMTEDQMEHSVRELVTFRGGRLFHLRDARQAPELEDLTDWLIVAPWMHRVFLIEAKSQKRIVTAGQAELLAMLAECHGCESGIVRPVPKPGEIAFDDFLSWLGGQS